MTWVLRIISAVRFASILLDGRLPGVRGCDEIRDACIEIYRVNGGFAWPHSERNSCSNEISKDHSAGSGIALQRGEAEYHCRRTIRMEFCGDTHGGIRFRACP